VAGRPLADDLMGPPPPPCSKQDPLLSPHCIVGFVAGSRATALSEMKEDQVGPDGAMHARGESMCVNLVVGQRQKG